MMYEPPKQTPKLRDRINNFFYAEEVPFSLALIRIVMPLVLMVPLLPRWPHARELYSLDGAPAPLWDSYSHYGMLPILPGAVVVLMHSTMIISFLTAAIGWCTRASLITATVLFTYLNLCDSISTITKYSVVATHVLLLLCLSECGAVWSVDAWLKRRRRSNCPGVTGLDQPRSTVWPRRLIQLMIGIVYFGAAATKIHTPAFFSGDQMIQWMRTYINHQHPMGDWMAEFPLLVVISGYISITWEATFLFLAWRGIGRVAMLGLGVIFHVMTYFLLGLHVFPLVCITVYLSFLNEAEIRRGAAWFRRMRRRLGLMAKRSVAKPAWILSADEVSRRVWQGRTAWVGTLIVLATLGLLAEHWLDPYQKRGPDGPMQLTEMDPQIVRTMIAPSEPIRPQDKVYSFDLGGQIVGEHLIGQKREFRHGEKLIAQANFIPPHGDMALTCTLEDEFGRAVERIHVTMERERFRAHFLFPVQFAYAPGTYDVVLSNAGREMARRPFRIVGGPAVVMTGR